MESGPQSGQYLAANITNPWWSNEDQPAPPAKRMRLQDDIAINSDYAYTLQPSQDQHGADIVPPGHHPGDEICIPQSGLEFYEEDEEQSPVEQPAIGVSVVQSDYTTAPLQSSQQLQPDDQQVNPVPSFKGIGTFAGKDAPNQRRAKDSKCHLCNNTFESSYKLKLHMFSHTGEKPFVSEICGKGFTSGPNLNQYLRVHSAGGFPCPHCSKAFRHRHDRIVHVLIQACTRANRHLRQTAQVWHCLSCGRQFATKEQAEYHVRQHELVKGMFCPVCNQNFHGERVNALVRHVKKQHCDYIPNLGL